jgi:hypothetical protein
VTAKKDTWYVSYELPIGSAKPTRRPYSRMTVAFQTEIDAKNFAKARLVDARDVNAGTLNPHTPKRLISSTQVLEWLEEP